MSYEERDLSRWCYWKENSSEVWRWEFDCGVRLEDHCGDLLSLFTLEQVNALFQVSPPFSVTYILWAVFPFTPNCGNKWKNIWLWSNCHCTCEQAPSTLKKIREKKNICFEVIIFLFEKNLRFGIFFDIFNLKLQVKLKQNMRFFKKNVYLKETWVEKSGKILPWQNKVLSSFDLLA